MKEINNPNNHTHLYSNLSPWLRAREAQRKQLRINGYDRTTLHIGVTLIIIATIMAGFCIAYAVAVCAI